MCCYKEVRVLAVEEFTRTSVFQLRRCFRAYCIPQYATGVYKMLNHDFFRGGGKGKGNDPLKLINLGPH